MAFHRARALQEAEKSVAQGKIAQAIKQYLDIIDIDPSDLSLYNTVGDLYIRERNVTEGLRQFHKLAEAYVREGFNVKAIAIYRKISKFDPNSVDTLLKLGELYQLQGLSREAREQFLQAVEFFKKRDQPERALEVLRKLVLLDPENINFHNRLAAECEEAGKQEDAALAYLESAEILVHRGDQAAAELALKKAAELNPRNSKIQMLRARVAVARHEPEEAERIINSTPELQSDPAVKRILLDSYLGTGKLPEAEKLVRELFHANPSEFAPVSSVASLLAEKGDIDQAYHLLSSVADQLISQHNAGLLLEALRTVCNNAPAHIPTLELIHRICEQTADEMNLPEVLEALGHAHEQAGDLEKAEAAYLKLSEREPENETYRGLLKAIQHQLGRDAKVPDFSAHEMALEGGAETDEETLPEPEVIDLSQELMVNEALENSDLFARYNLPEKAIAELEKVLQVYPDQIEVHQRILEISRKGLPGRGAVAATQLARIFAEHGDAEMAGKYQAIAAQQGTQHETPQPPASPGEKEEGTVTPPPGSPETPEAGKAEAPPMEPVAAPAAPSKVAPPFDLTPPETPSEAPAALSPPLLPEQTVELDLSGDLEAMTALSHETPAPSAPVPAPQPEPMAPTVMDTPASAPVAIPAPPPAPAPPPVVEEATPIAPKPAEVTPPAPGIMEEEIPDDLEESRIEVEFYLENGFVEEARQTVSLLEEKYPGSAFVANLRRRVGEQDSEEPTEPLELEAFVPKDEPVTLQPHAELPVADAASPPETSIEAAHEEPAITSPVAPATRADELAQEDWELPTTYALPPYPEPAMEPVVPPPPTEPVVEKPAAAASGGAEMLGDLAGELASSLEGIVAPSPKTPAAPQEGVAAPPAAPSEGVAQLSGLLAEMEESDTIPTQDDPETHYNLGVAFREMGLLDESIGEFQKVVKGSGKGNYPPNFLQACSLLAICFMEKKMPAIAVKWYLRALETPALDEEALMALQYDLGVAYEQAGNSRNALERFTEVYSQNIDFRDVADKIRELQQKT